jgi:aerobic carbon-monoxide dehydrogenase large subunit
MEPRAMLARWDASAKLLQAWLPTQTPWRARIDLAQLLGLPPSQVQVVAPDVGGAFGARSSLGPEEFVIAWAACEHACDVRWAASRSEFTAGMHSGRAAWPGSVVSAYRRRHGSESDQRDELRVRTGPDALKVMPTVERGLPSIRWLAW